MSTLQDLHDRVLEQSEQLQASPEVLADLSASLDLDGEVESILDLVRRVVADKKVPNFLFLTAHAWPDDDELSALLRLWEQDANLHDIWVDEASARDLQLGKLHYVMSLAPTEEHPEPDPRLQRLLHKISRALKAHPENVRGEFEVYGDASSTALVGQGKVANVYEAERQPNRQQVAVKVLKPEHAHNPYLVEHFIKATAARALTPHAQIAQVLTPAVKGDKHTFAVLEWRGHGNLEAFLGQEGLSLAERQQVALKVCQGLAWAHSRGVVHGDLKPSNVLVNDAREVRLTDFLADPDDLSPEKWPAVIPLIGNQFYLAPEISGGRPHSVSSDIFSLGRLLFRLMTGKDENLYDVMVPDLFKKSLEQYLGDYPNIVEIIQTSTAMSVEDRPESVRAILVELHRLGGDLGVDADADASELRAGGQWVDLADRLQDLVVDMDSDRIPALLDLADLQEYVIGDPRAALESVAGAYIASRGQLEIEAQLERIFSLVGDDDAARVVGTALSRVLESDAIVDDSERSLALNLRAAEFFHKRGGDADSAIPRYLAAMSLEPGNSQAFEALDEIFQAQDNGAELVALYERWLQTIDTDEERVALFLRIANAEETSLGDKARAVDTYKGIQAIEPRHDGAYSNLDRLYRDLERWPELVTLIDARLQGNGEPSVELLNQLAWVHDTHLDEASTAVDLCVRALEVDPDNAETVTFLEGLLEAERESLRVAGILEPIYRRREAWAPLASALEVLLSGLDVRSDAWVSTLREVAEIREQREQRASSAFDAYARIHSAHPTLEWVCDEMERVAPICDPPDWSELDELYRSTIEAQLSLPEVDNAFVSSLWLRLSRVLDEHLDAVDAAITANQEVLGLSPDHPEALDNLERFFQRTEAWEELIDVLDNKREVAELHESFDEARAFLHQIAGVREQRLNDLSGAVRALAASLSLEDDDPQAVGELERISESGGLLLEVCEILDPFYERHAQWDELLALLRRKLDDQDDDDRADTFIRMAATTEHNKDDGRGAFGLLVAGYRTSTGRQDIQDELERLAEALEDWSALADFYDQLLAEGDDLEAAHRQEILLRLARIYRDQLNASDEAEARFLRVLEIDPNHGESLQALDDIYLSSEQWERLHAVLARKASLAEEIDDKKVELFRMGTCAYEQLGDAVRAVSSYLAIHELDPEDCEALDGLARIHAEEGEYRDLLDVLQERVALEDEPHKKLEFFVRIGDLARTELEEPVVALRAYEAALELGPDRPKRMLLAMVETYLDQGDYARYYGVLPTLLEHVESAEECIEIHKRAADLAKTDAVPEGVTATEHYAAILDYDSLHPVALEELEVAYAEAGQWIKLKDIYRRAFVAVHLKAARLASDHLNDPDEAIAHLTEARRLAPGRVETIDGLCRVYTAKENWDAVAELLSEKAQLVGDDPVKRAGVVWELAALYENRGEFGPALEQCLKALALHPEERALLYFIRLALREERLDDTLPDLVEDLRAHDGDDHLQRLAATLELIHEGAGLMASGDPDGANDALLPLVVDPALEPQLILDLVRPVYEHYEHMDFLASLINAGLATDAGAPPRRQTLYLACGTICEDLDDEGRAFDVYAHLFNEQPGEPVAREHLFRVAASIGWTQLAMETVEKRLEDGLDESQWTIDLALLVAEHYTNEDTDKAISHYQRVLEVAPEHRQALEALEVLYRQTEAWVDLVRVLEQMLALATAPAEAVVLMLKEIEVLVANFDAPARLIKLSVGVLSEEMEADEDARTVARTTLEGLVDVHCQPEDEHFVAIAEALKSEYARLGASEEHLAVLRRQLGLCADGEHGAAAGEVLVEMMETALNYGDRETAFEYGLRAIEADASREEVYREVETLSEDLDRGLEVGDLYAGLLDRPDLPGDAFRLELTLRVAGWKDSRDADPHGAALTYEAALELDPDNMTAILALEDLHGRLDNHRELMAILQKRAELSADGEQRLEFLSRAADIAHHKLEDYEEAIKLYEDRVASYGPTREVLSKLEELYSALANHEELLRVLGLQLELVRWDDDGDMTPLSLRMASIAHDDLGDGERAIGFLRDVLADAPEHPAALTQIAGLYEELGRWDDLLDTLKTQLASDAFSGDHLEINLRAGAIAEEHLDRIDEAVEHYRIARILGRGDAHSAAALYRVLELQSSWFDLLQCLLEDLDAHRHDAEFVVRVSLRIAEMALDVHKLDDRELALEHLLKVLDANPNNLEAIEKLIQFHEQDEAWEATAEALGRLIAVTESADDRVALLLKRGDIFRDKLEELDRATADYRTAYRMDETASGGHDRLIEIYNATGAWHEILDILERDAARCEDAKSRLAADLKIADLIHDKNLGRDKLLAVLTRAYQGEPGFPANVEIILRLVDAHMGAGNLSDASACVEIGFELTDGRRNATYRAALFYKQGLLMSLQNNPHGAIFAHEECFKLDNSNLANNISYGELLFAGDRFDECIKVLQVVMLKQADLEDAQKVGVYYLMGRARAQLGDARRAKDMFTRALAVDRDHQPSRQALDEL